MRQPRTEQDQHRDLEEEHSDIILEEQSTDEKDELGNIIKAVLVIEKEIAIEASSIVTLASENLAGQLFLLEPDDVQHYEEGWEISDDTNELTDDILAMTDGEMLQEELETSAISLVSQLPKTQSEVELAESSDEVISETESVTESSDAVSPLHVSAKRNAFVLTSEGSTDSDIVPVQIPFPNSASSIIREGHSAPLSEEDPNQSECIDLLGPQAATENIDAVIEITSNTDCDPGNGAGPSEAGWGASESGLQNCTAAAASWIDRPGRASPALQSDPATDTASTGMAGRVAEPEEGWGDDIRLDTIDTITIDQCEDNLFCKDKDSELESWLEMKHNEFEGMIVKDGSVSEDDEAVNISLFSTEDLSGIDSEVVTKIIIEENNVINEDDNNALTNINGSLKEAPNISKIKKKRAIRSPILKRKEIKACINLHNACEESDVLQEIIGPSVRFSEDTPDICEAVLDEDELTDEEGISSEVSAASTVRPAVSAAEMSQLLTKFIL